MKTNKILSISLVIILNLSGLIVIAPSSSAGFTGDFPAIKNKIQADTKIIEQVDTHLEKLLSEFDQDPDLQVLEDVKSELRSITRNAQRIVYNIEPYLDSPDNQGSESNLFDNIDFGKLNQGTVGQLHAINNELSKTEKSLDRILKYAWAPKGKANHTVQTAMKSVISSASVLQSSAQSVLNLIGLVGPARICRFHSPIQILNNGDFTAANGVIWGSGTSTSPYIIGGWNINASTAHGIEIRNTDAHFIIRDVCVHSGQLGAVTGNHGIFLRDVSHGTIETSTIWDNNIGIYPYNTANIHIEGNTISDNGEHGVFLRDSPNAEIVNNDIFDNGGRGIGLSQSNHSIVTENDVYGNNDNGIFIYESMDVTITHNRASENGLNGLGLSQSNRIVITENDLHENGEYGIFIGESMDVTITHNRALENIGTGIGAGHSENIIISQNDAIENDGNGILILSSREIRTIDNLINSNGGIGITISGGSSNVQIEGNIVSNNYALSVDGWGISILSSNEVEVIDNLIFSNRGTGIGVFSGSLRIRILRNAILDNIGDQFSRGISTNSASDILIVCNDIRYHIGTGGASGGAFSGVGIELSKTTSRVTVFHNNLFNNSAQAADDGSGNNWDIGYPSGGNYWSDYEGTDSNSGPAQDVPGSDGIGDIPYPILYNKTDRYPLMEPCRNSFWNLFWIPSQQLIMRVNKQMMSNLGTLGKLGERLESIFETSDNIYDDATIVAFITMQENANSISEQITEKLGDNPPPPNLNPGGGANITKDSKNQQVANKIAANTKILVQVDSRLEGILDDIDGEPGKSTAAALSAMRDAANSIVNRITEVLDDFPVPPDPTD